MILLERTYTFEAAHSLPNVPKDHKCGRVHGHSYTVTIAFQGAPDSFSGMLIDFGDIDKWLMLPIIAKLDHTLLNDHIANPTSENLAKYIFEQASTGDTKPVWVRVSETSRSAVTYMP